MRDSILDKQTVLKEALATCKALNAQILKNVLNLSPSGILIRLHRPRDYAW